MLKKPLHHRWFVQLFSELVFTVLASGTFFSLIPSSTLNTIPFIEIIVSPLRDLILGSHPSGMRSSIRRGSRSRTWPPNIVKRVDEL